MPKVIWNYMKRYEGGHAKSMREPTYLNGCNCDNIVSRRDQPIHAPIPVDLCQSLLQQLHILAVQAGSAFGVGELTPLRRHSRDGRGC